MKFKFDKVTILGMGLMGGSLGKTLLKDKIAKQVMGWGRNIKKLKKAILKNAATKVTTDIKEAVKDADIVLISLPVSLIPEYFKKINPYLKSDCLVTDIGSIKEKIVREIKKIDKKHLFIGSHPMVGSEKKGIDNIMDNLYKDGVCIITMDNNTDKNKLNFLKLFWKKIGMRLVILSPSDHDKYMAGISHFPHLLVYLLILLQKDNIAKRKIIIGKGFLDTTRIAASGEEIWTDIFMDNKENVLNEIKKYIKELNRFKLLLEKNEKIKIKKILKKAKLLREQLK